MTFELNEKLQETGNTHEVLETGYTFDDRLKTKIKYKGACKSRFLPQLTNCICLQAVN